MPVDLELDETVRDAAYAALGLRRDRTAPLQTSRGRKRATLSAMSLVRKAPRSAIVVRAVAFGNPDGSVWGAGLDAGVPAVVASGGAEPVAVALGLERRQPGMGVERRRGSR